VDRRNDSGWSKRISLLDWVKHYEEPSIYGYEEGRASKISLRRNGKTVFNFDRGMDIPPEDEETETALAILLKQYN